jgi:cellulose synthase operon protein C
MRSVPARSWSRQSSSTRATCPLASGKSRCASSSMNLIRPRKALAKLRQDFGDHVEVLGIEGWFALGTGDFAGAEKKLGRRLEEETRHRTAAADHPSAVGTEEARTSPQGHARLAQGSSQGFGGTHATGRCYLSLGRDAEAAAAYEQVVKLVPNHVPALNNLAWLNRDKAPRQAMDYAQKAYQLAPKDPSCSTPWAC